MLTKLFRKEVMDACEEGWLGSNKLTTLKMAWPMAILTVYSWTLRQFEPAAKSKSDSCSCDMRRCRLKLRIREFTQLS